MLGYHTPTPWEQTPPRSRHPLGADTPLEADTPLGADTPWEHTDPPKQTPPRADTPGADTPPQEADSCIRSMSGRYASYWNAFLFLSMRSRKQSCFTVLTNFSVCPHEN